nr:glycosyltransferase [Lysinibacillus timonensis]
MSKIDIIVPVYNVEKSLDICIDSIINQTMKDINIILINDGSTDNSGKICDSYAKKDPRITVLHIPNGGVSNARNIGIEHSSSKYIQFVDSDDYIDKNMCLRLYNNAEKYNADVTACGFVFETNNEVVKRVSFNGIFRNIEDFKNGFGPFYLSGYAHVLWNKLYKRQCIHTLFNTSISIGEDLLFNLEVFKNINSICCIKDMLYHYSYMNNMGLTRKKYNNLFTLKKFEFESVESFAFNYLKCNNETTKYLNSIIYRDIYTILKSEFISGDIEKCMLEWKKYLKEKSNNKTRGIKSNMFRFLILKFPQALKFLIKKK